MKRKINIRLIGIAVLAIITTLVGVTGIYYGLFQRQIRKDLSISAKIIQDTKLFERNDLDIKEIDLSTNINELRVTLIQKDGTVIYDNDVEDVLLSNHLDRPEIQEAFNKGEGQSVRRSNTLNKNTFYYAILLDNGNVLRVATDAQNILSMFTSTTPIIVLILVLIILLCISISHLLTKQLLDPIEMMSDNLDNLDYKSPYKELEPFSEKLRSQHAEILSTSKNRQEFTASVSHELKTPLTAISGYAELLETETIEKSQRLHFYQEIKRNANRLLVLINDIINLSELDRKGFEPDFQSIDLYDVCKDCMDELRINAKSKNISISLNGEKCLINADKRLIKELVENLVQNAIQYNNPNGKVQIDVWLQENRTYLSVKDNGIGISKQDQERVFERFYRVDKSRSKATGGTGLGLAIVKHIVEIHDGKIILESELNKGTEITVVF